MVNRDRSGSKSILGFVFTRRLPLESETALFIFVSALDIFMTWTLLSHGGFVESNPVADYFLDRWGRKGFVGFKFSAVAVVCIVCQLIALKRVDTARRVLNLGSAVVFGVVVYSAMLLFKHGKLF